MPQASNKTDTTLSRDEILRRREALGTYLAAWRESEGTDVSTWPEDQRAEYAELARTWFQLGLQAEDLERRTTRD